jgi:histidinol-phosphate aminotransferase
LLFLCRPNSPTGAVFSEGALRATMPSIPSDTLVVIDEAYREYDETPFDSRALLLDYPNLVVTRTFSKIYGMAGFRLGYGIMRPEVAAPLYTARDPFSVNTLALAAGLAALDDVEHLTRSRSLAIEGRRTLYSVFERLEIPYVPTQANFVLFDAGRPAAEVYEALVRKGVLIRPCASFGLHTWLRVTTGTHDQNRRFAESLEAVSAHW